jgi:hypothetical protein
MDVGGKRQPPSALDPERVGTLAGQQGPSRLMRKFSLSPEFEHRTAQLVAICYNEDAIPAHWRTQPGK